MAQVPPGPKDCYCPFWRKRMSEVCHTCPLWVQVRGKNPQSEQEIDQWNCSLGWLPMMLIENAQQQRQTGASTDKVATELKRFRDDMTKQNVALARGIEAVMLEHQDAE